MTNEVTTPFYNYIVDGFPGFLDATPGNFLPLREEAFTRFKTLGLPTTKAEDWRYTNVQLFLKDPFTFSPVAGTVTETQLAPASIVGLDAYRVVLVNGHFQENLSTLPAIKGVTIEPLAAAATRPLVQEHLGQHIHLQDQPFAALNTALFTGGLFIEVAANVIVDKPIYLLNVYTTTHKNAFIQPRNLWIIHTNAALEIVESVLDLSDNGIVLVNGVTETIVKENAEFSHYNLQMAAKDGRYIHYTATEQEQYSRYHHFNFTLPAASFTRNNLSVALHGNYTESNMLGLYVANDAQHVDNHTFVDHLRPNCNSNELYKGVLLDSAKAVFTGRIHVNQIAQKTNAFQQNSNLLLSDKADINSQPQLEIYADDVKCSHGFTVGQFNQEALFYLRSRGIGEEAARNMLVGAFAYDITDQVKIPAVQDYIISHIEESIVIN
ncbi:Iron-regulated ABC transporter permease protein SufD [Chitinophaga costaii]|uniref:Iron-regulated ABC transporter permease protein SufD n=1 Tax=Chitinophaga costaii TaxID=1335309 RepID=A0A1C4CSG2_9BACT|nr:Fe-S cluster assembly protein SufD [Chitinophaga costaii]PUZ26971.1 Fe-S cluster assembly protein SufD [Chitinophaga costaii]SCC21949.1 Iron-regulated ABC transporter permease protein SufD [Chitinophaga costaii]